MSDQSWLGEHWDNFKGGITGFSRDQGQYALDLWNIAFSPGDESAKTRVVNAWNKSLDFAQQQGGNFGGVVSPVFDAPGLKQLGAGLTWLQKTAVNRPIATAALAADSADRGDFGDFFSGDTWQKAWNDSRKVTAGQALTYNGMQLLGLVDPNDPNYDPRKSKEAYHSDWFYRTTSGTTDFFLALADPTRGVSKLARLGKLRLVDKAVSDSQIAKGALERQTFGNKNAVMGTTFDEAGGQLAPGVKPLYDQAAALDESTFTLLYTNQYAYGGIVGTALSAAAKRGDQAQFGDILMAARGSYTATKRIADSGRDGAALADAIGRYRNPYGIANIVEKQADDAASWEVADAQAASAEAAIVEQIVATSPKGTPEFGTLQGTLGAMQGRGAPKVRPTIDALRIGIHNFQRGSYVPLQVAPLYQRAIVKGAGTVARVMSPARGYASHLRVNEVASFRQFRANLERAGAYVDDETRNAYVTAYMASLTANERARVAGIADNFVIGKMAQAHGMTAAEAEKLIRDASLRRQRFRQMLNNSQKFMPDAFVKRANELLKVGAREEASRLQDYADQYRARVQSGELPGMYMQASDDLGRPILVVNNDWENPITVDRSGRMAAVPKMKPDQPLLSTQPADRLPMVDYQNFERALSRFAEPRKLIERYEADQTRILAGEEPQYNISKADYRKAQADRAMSAGRAMVEDVYDALNHVWSIAAILRPAQVLRNLGDEGVRSLTMIGVLPTILAGTVGLGRVAYNTTRRGMTWAQERNLTGSVRALAGKTHHEVQMDDLGKPSHVAGSESAGFYNYIDPVGTSGALRVGTDEAYASIEAALVGGHIDLDTYIAWLPWAARQGRVPFEISAILQEWAMEFYGKGVQGRRGLRREVLEYVSDYMGTAAFTKPRWQHDAAAAIDLLGYRSSSFRASHGLVLNPMTDEAFFSVDTKSAADYEFVAHRYLHKNPATGQFDDLDGIYGFAADHAEKLLAGNYKMHAKVASDGRIRLSIVRDMGMPRPVADRMTPKQRRDVLRGLKGKGSSGVRFVDGERSVTVPGVFAGMDGDFAKTSASAEYIPRAFIKGQRNADRAAQWNSRVDKGDITPFTEDADGKRMPHKDWGPAWEQTVNHQMANDEVARRFLQGQDEAQVLEWLDSADPGALRYLNDRPKFGLSADRHVSVVRAFVDYMSPPEGGQALRDRILNHEATVDDVRRSVPERLLPNVNGQVTGASLGTHPVMQWVQRRLDGWFRVMQDKPSDFLVRYPFIEHKYKGYFEPLYRSFVSQVPGHLVTQTEIDRIARMARQKAIDDTKRYLYDQTFRTDLANALSPLMPFSNAIADSFFKWAKIAWERPLDTLANWNLVYNWPERNGLVYDQDGNSLEYKDGKEVWHSALDGSVMADDVKHDRYVAFQPPSWIADKIPGGLKLVQFNKNSMTSAIFDPSINVGPLIALPVNEFALYHPEVGDSSFVKTYVLPFGPTSEASKILLPGLLRSASAFFTEDESKASSAAMAIYQTMLTDFRTGKRDSFPSLDEAKNQARAEQWLRFATSAGSPISFQYKSPYQPYVDLYSQLLRKHSGDDAKAMEEFRATAGDDYMYLAARVTKSNIALPSTMAGYKAFKAKQMAIQKYPELAGLITGAEGSGSFSKSVYEWEKQQTYDESGKPIREDQTIADSVRDLQRRTGWSDWVKYNAEVQNDLNRRGLKSINDQGAEDIKQRFAMWITARKYIQSANGELEVSPWYEDFKSTDGAAMDNRLVQMQQILMENPSWLQGRDELQGLARYLDMRRDMKSKMQFYGFATLESQKAQWLQDLWQGQVTGLRNQNNAFDQLYARWLIRDNLGAEGLAADQIIAALEGNNAQ